MSVTDGGAIAGHNNGNGSSQLSQKQLISLVQDLLARSDSDGALRLTGLNISNLPSKIFDLMRDARIERLSLQGNGLTTLPDYMRNMHQLRYLDLRGNSFSSFPSVVCELSGLEILDISCNKISALPTEPGCLLSLKVLSMAENRLQILPGYLAEMQELQFLELNKNPIIFPPSAVSTYTESEVSMRQWLENLRSYIRENKAESARLLASRSHNEPLSTPEKRLGPQQAPSTSIPLTSTTPTSSESTIASRPPIERSKTTYSGLQSRVAPSGAFEPQRSNGERFRSNSESSAIIHASPVSNRTVKRMGLILKKMSGLGAVPETMIDANKNHTRGLSHGSVEGNYIPVSSPSVGSPEAGSGAYFRRISSGTTVPGFSSANSSSPATPRVSANASNSLRDETILRKLVPPQQQALDLQSSEALEAARGILFSLSQIHPAISQYVSFCNNARLTGTLTGVLYNVSMHIESLIEVLDSYEAHPDTVDFCDILSACGVCVGAFKHVIDILQKDLRIFIGAADLRYTRSLLLLALGSFIELQNSWEHLLRIPNRTSQSSISSVNSAASSSTHLPLRRGGGSGSVSTVTATKCQAPPNSGSTSSSTAGNSMPSTAAYSRARGISMGTRNDNSTNGLRQIDTSMAGISGGNGHGPSSSSSSVGGAPPSSVTPDTATSDEQLFEKIDVATSIAQNVLAMVAEAAATGTAHLVGTKSNAIPSIRELSQASMIAIEVTRRLRSRLLNIRDGDMIERRRFWEDTNSFLKAVISVVSSAKASINDVPSLNESRRSLSTLTRIAKEVTVMLDLSSFRYMSDSHAAINNNTMGNSGLPSGITLPSANLVPPTTPLAAVLGPAAQAVLPSPSVNSNNLPNSGP